MSQQETPVDRDQQIRKKNRRAKRRWARSGLVWILLGLLLILADLWTLQAGINVSFGITSPLARLGAAGLVFIALGIVAFLWSILRPGKT
jgi:hypothetical protein